MIHVQYFHKNLKNTSLSLCITIIYIKDIKYWYPDLCKVEVDHASPLLHLGYSHFQPKGKIMLEGKGGSLPSTEPTQPSHGSYWIQVRTRGYALSILLMANLLTHTPIQNLI